MVEIKVFSNHSSSFARSTSRRVVVHTTNPDCTGADRRPSCSCNPGRTATGHTKTGCTTKGCTTRDPNRAPSSRPSRAIRSRSPNRPSPNRGPNRCQTDRPSNHRHGHRSPASCGKLCRRNRTRFLTKGFWRGRKSAIRPPDLGRHESRNLSVLVLGKFVLGWNAQNSPSCRRNATGHR